MNNESTDMPAAPLEAATEQGAAMQAPTADLATGTAPIADAKTERPATKTLAIICAIAIAGGLLGGVLGGIAVTSIGGGGQSGAGRSSSNQPMDMGGGRAPDGMGADGTDDGDFAPTMPDDAESNETPAAPDGAQGEGTEASDGTQSANDTSGSVLTPRSDGSLTA